MIENVLPKSSDGDFGFSKNEMPNESHNVLVGDFASVW